MSELNQDANETPPQQQPPTRRGGESSEKMSEKSNPATLGQRFDNWLELFDLTVLLELSKQRMGKGRATYFSP